MPSRLSSLAAFLFLTACTTSDPSGSPHEPRPELPRWPVEPIPADEVSSCVTAETGIAQFGTSGHDELRDVVVTKTGTILAAGYEQGMLSIHEGMVGSRGVVLAYTGAQLQRQVVLDTNGTDVFESIAIAPATGRVWLAARSNGDILGVTSRGGYDTVIGDVMPAGGFRPLARGFDWTSERVRQLAIAPDGFLAVAGHEQRTTPDNAPRLNPFVAAYATSDSAMAPLWLTTRRGDFDERYEAVDVSAQMVVVGGTAMGSDEQSMFIETHDRDAGMRWRQTMPGLGAEAVTAVELLPDGNVAWVGSTRNVPDDHLGGTDVVVGVLDGATGAPLWTKQLGGAGEDQAEDLAVDAAGRIHVVGATTAEGSTDLDAFLLVLDAGGDVVLEERWGSAGTERALAVTVDDCGAVVVVGMTDGDLGGAAHGGRDGFMLVARSVSP